MNVVNLRNDQLEIGSQVIDGRGYILDEPYIARYFDLQSPSRMAYSIRCNGFEHNIDPQNFRYCELGCGRGMTAALLAAAYPEAEFVALDLNPEHIAYAEALATQSGLDNIKFLQSDFVDALEHGWEPFDYITVHGVYSWVDSEIRGQMFELASKLLKKDGILYVSYNAYPGWKAKEPLWRLLNTHIKSTEGNSIERVKKGIEFLDFLVASNSPYFSENPAAVDHLEYLKSEDLRYISHEFCNEAFAPVYCSEIFEHAGQFGLEFIAQSETCYNIASEKVPGQYAEYIAGYDDRIEREVWTSMMRNDQFRTDLYSKVVPAESALEESQLWDMVFTNIVPIEKLDAVLECGSNEIDITGTLEAALIENCINAELTLSELCSADGLRQCSPRSILETAQLLELSGKFGFLNNKPEGEAPPLDANWVLCNAATAVLIKAQINDEAAPFIPATSLGTGLRVETIEALALLSMDGADQETGVAMFMEYLNTVHPELLGYRVSAEWCAGYLYDFRSQWGSVLHKLGIISGQQES